MAKSKKKSKAKSKAQSKTKTVAKKAKASKKAKAVKKVTKTTTKKSTTKITAAKKTTKKAAKKTAKPKGKVYPSQVKIGAPVPNFKIESTQGEFELQSLKGKKVVLYFYPKDHTSGCTVEGHDFSNLLDKFKAQNAVVYGVSRDSIKSHKSFIEKQAYKMDLLSDPEEKLCAIFGVMKEKSLYGNKYIGVDRSTFVIDENGNLTHEWRGVKVPGHAEAVLSAIQS